MSRPSRNANDRRALTEEMELWQTMLPIQRFASAVEVAEAAYFLAHAEYATGSCLSIDGGNTAGGAI
jgi:NAD(P)-dependent dehydrogenase (short-subunit alcohol dehydrogenase family)